MLLALAAVCLASGTAAGVFMPPLPLVVVAGFAAMVLAWRLFRRSTLSALAAGSLLVGLALGHAALRRATAPPPVPAAIVDGAGKLTDRAPWGAPARPDRALTVVQGTIRRGPDPVGADGGKSRLLVDVDRLAGAAPPIALQVTVVGVPPDALPGDRVELRVRPRPPPGLFNPGLGDPRLGAEARGVDLVATITGPEQLRLLERGSPLGPRRLAFRLGRALAGRLDAQVTDPTRAAFLRAMVVGERSSVAPAVEEGFRAAGATHALSVSGLHLAVVAGLVFALLRKAAASCPALALRAPPAVLAAIVALPFVALYTLLTGEAVATVRSALMASCLFGASIVNRPPSLAAATAAAALALLVSSPLLLIDISFQLSFASVIALALAARHLQRTDGENAGMLRRALTWAGKLVAASTAAAACTMALQAHHFGQITPAAPIGNVAIVPLVELLVLPCGLLGAALALAHPSIGWAPLAIADAGTAVVLAVADLFRRWAPVLDVRRPNVAETILFTAAMGMLLLAIASPRRRAWLVVGAVSATLGVASLGLREAARHDSDEVRVTFLDVGQGDAALVEGPNGFVALVDAGGEVNSAFDPGARVIDPVLRAKGISRIDLLVLSHPHPDHMNGMFHLLERFEVGALWTSGDRGRNPRYDDLIALARRRAVSTPLPALLQIGALVIEPLGPWLDDRIGAPPGLSVNDASLSVRIAYAGRTVVFTGDLEQQGEAELAAGPIALPADVLKVPHHGSRTSSSADLLGAARPWLAVASLGRENRFGFPHAEAVRAYASRGIRLLRTDLHGAVTVTIGADGSLRATCLLGCR